MVVGGVHGRIDLAAVGRQPSVVARAFAGEKGRSCAGGQRKKRRRGHNKKDSRFFHFSLYCGDISEVNLLVGFAVEICCCYFATLELFE